MEGRTKTFTRGGVGGDRYLAVVDDGQLGAREQVLHDGVEEWHVDRGQLGDVHVPHGEQQNLGGRDGASGLSGQGLGSPQGLSLWGARGRWSAAGQVTRGTAEGGVGAGIPPRGWDLKSFAEGAGEGPRTWP